MMAYIILNHTVAMDARFMKMNTESRTRGHTKKLKISRSKIEIRRNFFTNRIMNRWNGVSQKIINSKTTDAFKRAYNQAEGLIRRHSSTSSYLTAVNQPWIMSDKIVIYICLHKYILLIQFCTMIYTCMLLIVLKNEWMTFPSQFGFVFYVKVYGAKWCSLL